MNFAKQCLAILGISLSSATQRVGPVLTIIVGVTCAVGVLVSMLAMGTGARRQMMGDVRPDRVLISSTGAKDTLSSIPKDEATAVRDLPGIRKDAAGEPIVVFESLVPIQGRRRVTGNKLYFPLIGTTSSVIQYQPEMHLTAGRMFDRGLQELIASNSCARQFTGMEIGDRRHIHGSDWTIVGHFDPGKDQQCIVYADVDVIMSTFHSSTYSRVSAMLQSPADYDAFAKAIKANPSLHLEVEHERESRERSSRQINSVLNFVSYFVGTIMAIGATLGVVNSLYALVDSRRRELATLRAIGFGPGAVVVSILCESLLLALPGALLGCLLAWVFFNGLAVSPFGFNFQLDITASLALLGWVWTLGMGLLGGVLPALRAARVPVTTALRAAN
jgi:putative ABC transport system permease protein